MNGKKMIGNASKATLPNGKKMEDFKKQPSFNSNKINNMTNNSSLQNTEQQNKTGEEDNPKSKAEQVGGEVASEALKKSLKAAFPYIPQFIINKLVDSKLGQAVIEKQLKGIKAKIMFGLIGVVGTVLMWLFLMSAMLTLIMAPIAFIGDALSGIGAFFKSLGNWFIGVGWCATEGECQQLNEQEYYEKLTKAINDYKGSCPINEDLITATIFYGQMVAEEKQEANDSGNTDEVDENGNEVGAYFDYIRIKEDSNGNLTGPTAASQIDKLINVYWRGEEGARGEELTAPEVCSSSANAYRNYLINTYINDHYKSAITSTRTIDYIADEILKMGGIDLRGIVNACSDSCTYTIGDKSISELKVQLLDNNGNNIEGQEVIGFEEYILGVVYGELGVDVSDEVWKTQAIAIRSYVLSQASNDGDVKLIESTDGAWILYIKNTVSGPIYCDPNNGCSERNDGVIVSNPNDPNRNLSSTFQPRYGIDSNADLRLKISEVVGRIVLDANGNIVNTSYDNSIQEEWKNKAAEGKNYTEILGETYTDLASIEEGNCSALCSFAAGPYTEWKQTDPKWKDVPIANSTIGNIGCLTTAVSMQIARSGVYTPLGTDFSPGTLVQNYGNILYTSAGNWIWANITKVIPNFVYSSGDIRTGLLSLSNEAVANTISEKMSQGCYLVAEVKKHAGGQHWVAIDNVVGTDIYIMDPSSSCKTISQCGSKYKISQINCYKVKK